VSSCVVCFADGLTVLDLVGKQSKYKGVVPPLPVIPLLDLNYAMNYIIAAEKLTPADEPWKVCFASVLSKNGGTYRGLDPITS